MRIQQLSVLALLLFACSPEGSGGGEDPPDALTDGPAAACVEGDRRCNEREVELCRGGLWTPTLFCPAGTDCVAGDCEEVPCEADCEGRLCGTDGCGGVCGMCEGGFTCNAEGRCDPPQPRCGDDECNGEESCGTCPADCGSCCGNGTCAGDESCTTCPADCACEGADVCNALTRMCDPCEPQCEGRECGPDGCGGACGDGCPGGDCVNGLCVLPCVPECDGRECGPDGCGDTCGGCAADEVCDLEGACQPPPPACGDLECGVGEDCGNCPADCGACCGDDVCDGDRDENCATCLADCGCENGQGCNAELRRCVVQCVPQCGGRDCGDDGCGGNCGGCGGDQECQAGVCRDRCVPQCEGRACGGDACGGRCGECEDDELCDDGICEAACVAQCGGRDCGDDGCDGLCGVCDDEQLCNQGVCDDICQPNCEGLECGDDGCGGECGPCVEGVCLEGACCVPLCDDAVCGDDGCGDVCGVCDDDALCIDGACCAPACDGRLCGDDGCGDVCGVCDEDAECDPDGQCVPVDVFCQCEGADVCLDGFCRGPAELCADENPNGLCPGGAACQAGECVNQGAACTPQNPTGVCELGQICRDGACAPFDGALLCDDRNACTADRFDHLTNRCVNEPADAGCDDGNGCTMDACEAGVCVSRRMDGCLEPPGIDPYETPTNVGEFNLAGTKPAGASVRVNGQEAVPESPEARWEIPLNLQPGENVYTVTSVDGGQESAAVVVRIVYDVEPPHTRATPAGGVFLDGITTTVTSDEAATIFYTDDGGTPDAWSRSFRSVKQFRIFDDTVLRFRARDVAGNWEEEIETVEFEITGDGNRWDAGPEMPEPLTLMGGALHDGLVYLVGGTDGLASQAGVRTYDPSTNEWDVVDPLPVARAQLAAVSFDGTVWAIGGEDDGLPMNFNQSLEAGGGWGNHAPMPTTRFGLAAVAVGNRIYAFGGKTNGGRVLDRLEVYNPANDTWSNEVAQMPRARYGHNAIEHGGRVYVIGGEDEDGNPIAEVDVYSIGGDAWAPIADLPTPRSFATVTKNHNTGDVAGGYVGLVVAGGRVGGGAATTVVEEYVIDDAQWRPRRPLPEPRHSGVGIGLTRTAAVDSQEVRGYVFGGLRGGVVTADSRYYTQVHDYLRHLAPMPEGRFMHAAEEQDGRIFLFGGRTFAETQLVWAFDPETGRYDVLPELPSIQNGLASATYDGLVYAVGGANQFGVALPTLRRLDPASRQWEARAVMPTGRRDAAAAFLEGELWIVGGHNNGALQAVEIYDPATDEWRAGPVLPEGRSGADALVHDGELVIVGGVRPNGALHTAVLALRDGAWVEALQGVSAAHANAVLVHDHQLDVFGGQRAAGPTNAITSINLSTGWISRELQPQTNLVTAVDFAATAYLNGSFYIFGGNDEAPVGAEGLPLVQKIDARCFNGVHDGREVASNMGPFDVGGGCPREVPLREGDLRLRGGNRLGVADLLQVYHNGSWGTICDDSFGLQEVTVACRQIFGPGHRGSLHDANGSGIIWLDDLACGGGEARLVDCPHRGWGNHNCGHQEDVALRCDAQ